MPCFHNGGEIAIFTTEKKSLSAGARGENIKMMSAALSPTLKSQNGDNNFML